MHGRVDPFDVVALLLSVEKTAVLFAVLVDGIEVGHAFALGLSV